MLVHGQADHCATTACCVIAGAFVSRAGIAEGVSSKITFHGPGLPDPVTTLTKFEGVWSRGYSPKLKTRSTPEAVQANRAAARKKQYRITAKPNKSRAPHKDSPCQESSKLQRNSRFSNTKLNPIAPN